MSAAGSDYLILSFSINGTYSNVTTTRAYISATVQAKGAENVVIRKSSSDTKEFDLNGSILTIAAKTIPDSGVTKTICQAKTASGNDETLQVILTLI